MTSGHWSESQRAWRKLLGRVARATRKPESAEDLLHSAYVRMEEYCRKSKVDNPSAFLVRVAVNLSVDEGRRERTRSESGQDIYELIDLSDAHPLQSEVLIVQERLERVKAGLARLSPRTRSIFLMHRIDGLKYREIAAQAGISVSAVEKHIAKAILFLSEWAEGY